MQPFPVAYEPSQTMPCFSARSRREVNTIDSTNARMVEHWQTDSPALINTLRNLPGTTRYYDMNATPGRLYRENLNQSQPYVSQPSAASVKMNERMGVLRDYIASLRAKPQDAQTAEKLKQAELTFAKLREQLQKEPPTSDNGTQEAFVLEEKINSALNQIGNLEEEEKTLDIRRTNHMARLDEIQKTITSLRAQISAAQAKLRDIQTNRLSANPYFEKYDVQSDSRNVVRELRKVVSEDVVDRGLRESQRLLTRDMDNRWVQPGYAQDNGLNSLDAYELMRPKFNDMTRNYR